MYIYGKKCEDVQFKGTADHVLWPFSAGPCVVTTCALPDTAQLTPEASKAGPLHSKEAFFPSRDSQLRFFFMSVRSLDPRSAMR
jgi:hypothetical protein